MKDEDVIGQYRSRKEYIKPSQRKRVQKNEAIRKNKYELKKQAMMEKNYIWTAMVKDKAQ